jgi:hypothetical protein
MPDLRPMEFGEVLDGAFTLFRRNFPLFLKLGITALWLPVALLVYVQLTGGLVQHPVLLIVYTLLSYFAGLFLTAGAIRIIADTYLGREPSLADALQLGASKIWPLFFVGLGKGVIIGGMAFVIAMLGVLFANAGAIGVLLIILLAVGGVWLVVYVASGYGVTTQVVVLEDLNSASDAFGRSWELTRGFRGKLFGLAFVSQLIIAVPSWVVSVFAAYFAGTPGVSQGFQIMSALLPIALTPIVPCVFTLLYYDLRVRREAFDLQLLGQQLGIA